MNLSANFGALTEWYIDNLDVSVRNGDECRIRECLFCGSVRTLKVNVRTGKFKCFHRECLVVGGPVALIRAILDCDYDTAVGKMSGILRGVRTTEMTTTEMRARLAGASTARVPGVVGSLPEFFTPCHRDGRYTNVEYLLGRGVSRDSIRRWGIGYTVSGELCGRSIVPVRTAGVVSWVARANHPKLNPKYLTPKDGPRRVLFGYDEVEVGADLLVAVEGVFDAIRLWSYGIPTVAYLKDGLSYEQVGLVERLRPRRLVIFPDGADRKAQARALRDGAGMATRFAEVAVVVFETEAKVDPDSAPRELVECLIAEAPVVRGTDLVRFKLGGVR